MELEEQVVELERRENVLIQALSDETWAEVSTQTRTRGREA